MVDKEVDHGAYIQAPGFYLLRNACVPCLAAIIVQEFKNARYIQELSNNISNVDIENITIFELLKKIHNKGKKEEDKRRKATQKHHMEAEESDTFSRTLHLNNLKEYDELLSKFKVCDYMDEKKCEELTSCFKECDVTFLLNLITNDVLHYQIDDELFKAIAIVKDVRNSIYHSGRKVECHDFETKFQNLCFALEVFYRYLKWDSTSLSSFIKEIKSRCHENISPCPRYILDELQREITSKKIAECTQHHIVPILMDSRGDSAVIEDFEKFLGQDKLPILLCGAPGSGKSTILQRLEQNFRWGNHCRQFQLVIYLDSAYRISNQCNFKEAVSENIRRFCPKTLKKFGIDFILCTIENHADQILFLADWNIGSLEDKRHHLFGGKWVICSQTSYVESSPYFHIVRVLPLTNTLVEQMIGNLISDRSEYKKVLHLYEECEYKSLINIPDMVAIFSEIRTKTPQNLLFQAYLDKKLASAPNSESECQALGKLAFYSILKNKKEYSSDDLCGVDISAEIKELLLVDCKNNSFTFRYRIIEDMVAAKYIDANPENACKDWLKQVPLFKRVFKFVCGKWCENEIVLSENLPYIRDYLYRLFDVVSKRTKARGREISVDILNKNAEFSKEESFTKWHMIISIIEHCKFHSDMIQLLCEMLSQKTVWIFKCKYLDEEKVNKLAFILERVQLWKPTVIKIESGSVVLILSKIWQMLSNLSGLIGYATVQITIRHREIIPVTSECSLSKLPGIIAIVKEPLYITMYKGPFMCSDTPEFLKCLCMRKLEVLDVYVSDVATLAEVLSCEGLVDLKAVLIKLNLRSDEKVSTNFPILRIPKLQGSATLTITIKYFEELQNLLENIENRSYLKSLIIHDMYIKEDFKLDFSSFNKLESLFIRFNPYAAQRYNVKPMDFGPHCWALKLSLKLTLPKLLERLLLRNTRFCDDSNVFQMINIWKRNDIQRLILLDSRLSIQGVRNILKSLSDENSVEQTEQKMKRICLGRRNDSTNVRECFTKVPRLDKEERERKRKEKPEGKELIITSLCEKCDEFPCCCRVFDRKDIGNSLEDVVHLIEDTYQYDILSLSYYSKTITVRKDICGDLRVHCSLTCVEDDTVTNLNEGNAWVKSFFHSLTLAQTINLDYTNLTHIGAQIVINKMKELKERYCNLPGCEPFSLFISSFKYHDIPDDEIKNSTFMSFLIEETCLVQFRFCCCCEKECHYLRRTRGGRICLNGEFL